MSYIVIGALFIIQGLNLLFGWLTAFWMAVILIVGGIYVIYKHRGEVTSRVKR